MAAASSSTSSSDGGLARFCRRALLFGVLQGVIFVALAAAFVRANSQGFLASTRDKHARARSAQAPRMLFVGGSNLAFGIDGELVRQRTRYNPVNLGVSAVLGMDFMLNEALDEVRPGDVVVVSLEYTHLAGYVPKGEDLRALMSILLFRPQNLTYLSWRSLPALLDHGFCLCRTLVRSADERYRGRTHPFVSPYRRDSFDLYGDVVAHRGMDAVPIDTTAVGMRAVSPACIDAAVKRLNRFQAACQAQGVFACYVYPPIPRVCLEGGRAAIAEVERALTERLTMPVLNRPEDVAWPLEWFFDTPYHLRAEAMTRRTGLLLDSLGGALGRFASDADGRDQFRLELPGRSARQ
jgi:hypothetical protein